jgi:hypothetical protein
MGIPIGCRVGVSILAFMFLREDFARFYIPMISADFWHTFHDTQEGDNYDLMEEGEKVKKKLQKLASSGRTLTKNPPPWVCIQTRGGLKKKKICIHNK